MFLTFCSPCGMFRNACMFRLPRPIYSLNNVLCDASCSLRSTLFVVYSLRPMFPGVPYDVPCSLQCYLILIAPYMFQVILPAMFLPSPCPYVPCFERFLYFLLYIVYAANHQLGTAAPPVEMPKTMYGQYKKCAHHPFLHHGSDGILTTKCVYLDTNMTI